MIVMSLLMTGFGPPGTTRSRPQNRGGATVSSAGLAKVAPAYPARANVPTTPTSPNPLSVIIAPS